MKKYIQTMPAVLAVQWKQSQGHPLVKFGISSKTDRFDDTPDGYYVNVCDAGGFFSKRFLKQNDWMIFDKKGETVVGIVDAATFEKQFSVEIPADIRSDIDFVIRLESDLGFMGSPSFKIV